MVTPAVDKRYIRQTRQYGLLALGSAVGMTIVIEAGAIPVSLYTASAIAGLTSVGIINVLWPQLLAPRFQANDARRRIGQRARRTGRSQSTYDDLSMPPTSPTS